MGKWLIQPKEKPSMLCQSYNFFLNCADNIPKLTWLSEMKYRNKTKPESQLESTRFWLVKGQLISHSYLGIMYTPKVYADNSPVSDGVSF